MKVAVIKFPGSNCDQDAYYALRDVLELNVDYVWHEQTSLAGFDAAFLPGGFSYGDYLRCGAMASRAPIMVEVNRFADEGKPVIGVCNGFQVLCEAGLLPGALLLNGEQKFICRDVYVRAESSHSIWTRGVQSVLRLPVAHGEGRYFAEPDTLAKMEERGQIAFRYVNPAGENSEAWNFNGSIEAIAGVSNIRGNVLGLMPHPERAVTDLLGGSDGLQILRALKLVTARL